MADASTDNGPAIAVEGLVKRYGDIAAVAGVDLEVARGEVFGFLGPNGAGKSTTIEILEGFRDRTSGAVTVLGVDPARPTREWRERIGLVLQESELEPTLTVRETLRMFAGFYREPRDVDATIDLVGLADQRGARVGTLSGGQRRRADVAVAIVGDPDLIFLDEPTTGLDPSARRDAWNMIEGLKELGKTIFLTTHYMEEAEHLADRVAILRRGAVVAQGRLDDLARGADERTLIRFRLPDDVSPAAVADRLSTGVDISGNEVVVRADDVQRMLLALLTWADEEDVRLEDLEVERPTLEDVFLDLTRDDRDQLDGRRDQRVVPEKPAAETAPAEQEETE